MKMFRIFTMFHDVYMSQQKGFTNPSGWVCWVRVLYFALHDPGDGPWGSRI